MNSFFAASLFDNPWAVIVIVIGGALVNWLSTRRAAKQAEQRPEGAEPPPASGKPPGEFNLDEALRRLMGEEPPARVPAPPPIPRAAQGEAMSIPDWEEEEPLPPVTQTVPTPRPPLSVVSPASRVTSAAGEPEELAARRFQQLNEQGRHPATVVDHGRGHRSRAGQRAASPWREPRSARRAFVAAIVFAPPKSLEP